MKYLACFIIALSVTAFGQPYPDTITITSADLPYTIPNNFTAYRIAPTVLQLFRINSNTNGIIVNGKHDIEIFGVYAGGGNGFATLNFAAGGGDGQYGILLASSYNVTIKNLNIYAAMGTLDDDNDSGNVCIRITGSTYNVLMQYGGLYPDGLDGKGINQTVDAGYNSYNLHFQYMTLYQYSNKFTRRDYYMASLMKFEFSKIIESPDYHVKIDNCIFSRSIHVAVAVAGSQVPVDSGALVQIFSNSFNMQGRNDLYTTFTDNSTQSLGDNFALSFIGLRRGSQIYGNTVQGDQSNLHYGGSGFLIQGAHGWPDDPIEFYDNTMVLRSGRHIALSALKQATQGFYIRSLDNVNSNQNLHVYNNDVKIFVDTSQATTSTGRVAEGIRVLVDTASFGIVIANNHITINRADSAAGLGNGTGESEVIASALTIAKQDGNPHENSILVYGNYFGSPKTPLRYGSNRESSYGANDTYLREDTIVSYEDKDSTIWFETNGSYVGHSTNNAHQDCKFLGGANPYDIVFAGGSEVDSLGKSVEHWQTVRLLCLGSDGVPLAGLPVYYANAYREGLAGYTNYFGWFERRFRVRYDFQDYLTGDTYNPGDSLMNPFEFSAYTVDLSDSASTTMTVTQTVHTDTLVFANTLGTPAVTGTYLMLRRIEHNPTTEIEIVGPPVP